MNTLRLWGGGVIFHDPVYDLADELGIMLIQEFPLANHLPPKEPDYLAMLEATARNIVRQVRNHPSIIEFDGGNEMHWKSDTDHPALHLLRRIVAEDDGRTFRATCPDLGSGHGPWEFDRKWYGPINEFNVMVNLHGKNQLLRPTMRQGEFGTHSPAHLEVWHREIPPKDQWPIVGVKNEVLHRKRAVRAIGPYNWLNMNILEDVFGPFGSLPELVEAGQFYGADGLRYMVDALRRTGKRLGGLTTWDFNEPWPNGAGSYLVDYDGRPRMMYDFLKQALAPLSLSLKYDSPFYPLDTGIKAELFLTSDAPQPAENLRWKWLARDRRGTVFARNEGTAAIAPLEVKSLGAVTLTPPAKTVFGPIFVELRLEDSGGKLLTERLHVFGLANLPGPLAQLVKNQGADPDDDASQITTPAERPADLRNQLYLLLGKSMTPPPPNTPPQGRGLLNVNDGYYGNDRGWSDGWFEFKLRGKPTLGRFKFGRDRTGVCTDRCVDYMKIETSLDGETWQTVFEQDKLSQLPGFSPAKTVEIQTKPVQAQYLKVTVIPPNSSGGPFPVIDEFEAYAPSAQPPATLPHVAVLDRPEVWRPMRHTTLEVQAAPVRIEGEQEVLELTGEEHRADDGFPLRGASADQLPHRPADRQQSLFHPARREPHDHDPRGIFLPSPSERGAGGEGLWLVLGTDRLVDLLLECRQRHGGPRRRRLAGRRTSRPDVPGVLGLFRPAEDRGPEADDLGRHTSRSGPVAVSARHRETGAVRVPAERLFTTAPGAAADSCGRSIESGPRGTERDGEREDFRAVVARRSWHPGCRPGPPGLPGNGGIRDSRRRLAAREERVGSSGQRRGWFTWDALECIAGRIEQRSGE